MTVNHRVVLAFVASLAIASLSMVGCTTTQRSDEGPKYGPASEIDLVAYGHLVRLHKTAPAVGSVGETIVYTTYVEAAASATDVIITDYLADGVVFVKSEPRADVEGNRLTFVLGDMRKGEKRKIEVWVRLEKTGDIVSCTRLSAVPYDCVVTRVGKPALTIVKTGPATAILGSDVTYNVVVTNTGNATAKGVVLMDTIPAELAHSTGQKSLRYDIGDLRAGESKSFNVTLKAVERGNPCNRVSVRGEGIAEVKAEACTLIVKPGVDIAKTGPKEQIIGRTASYQVTVTNTGDTSLSDVVVTDEAPKGTRIISAEGGTVRGNQATWSIGSLGPREKRTFTIDLTSAVAGYLCNRTMVVTGEGLTASAESCTTWRGVAAILLETMDHPDPIQVGETTTYTVRVTNQGNADDTNVKVVIKFGKEIDPVRADGGTISGKEVTFPAIPRLAPKQAVTFTVIGKGVATGDHRLSVDLISDVLTKPVTHEESTHVY